MEKIKEIEAEINRPDFWHNRESADKNIKLLGELQNLINRYQEIEKGIKALERDFDENGSTELTISKFYEVKRKFRKLELEELFRGRYDKEASVISVYPGVGGEDASDWAKMLFEMYQKYAARQGWKTTVLDETPNRRALAVGGDYAYGYLKGESGVHRLVRISPFSAKKLRHTSFALVEVTPELPELEESKLVIPEKDLKVEFYRSSGPGGQNVNKVETAVRVIHLPTGLSAASQAERSQGQNRARALKFLKAKIFHVMEKNKVQELANLRINVKPEWGSQIRSYVLNPYKLVKDHRTEIETTQVDEVLQGDLEMFIEAEVEASKE